LRRIVAEPSAPINKLGMLSEEEELLLEAVDLEELNQSFSF